jgi:epoxyqueuosine reductase
VTPSPKQALTEHLRQHALSLGFTLCRFADCSPPPHAGFFHEWLEQGFHGEMQWLERNKEKRTDPQLVLPGARSVVVLALNYWQPDPPADAHSPPKGRIARYAWGDDYHEVIEKKLVALDTEMRAAGGIQKIYTDTGPVLERDYAALSGMGWHGKSTMLVHPKTGTFFFLAEALTTLELSPDPPMADHCGKCTRCITACPTQAIRAPHQLDARRCVSYLTIELKGAIPEELRPLIGDRIYGCDDCLDACPWNRFARTASETAFAIRPFVHQLSLRDLLELDEDAFRTLFRKSPIKRIKRRGLMRNVCVALGNVGSPEDLPALRRAAASTEPLVSEHALWAIKQISSRFPENTSPPTCG